MAVTRSTDVIARGTVEDAAHVELWADWDYDDVNQVGVKLYGLRLRNHTVNDWVYGLWVYGTIKGGTRELLHHSEHQPGTDTGMVSVGPYTLRSGGFTWNLAPMRVAP